MSVEKKASLPKGFLASGTTCGIKASGKPDLALFVTDRDATAAGVFTTNRVCGAPVIVSKQRVPTTIARAVIINSGNSNAATGEPGIEDARAMTAALASQLRCDNESVSVCSTGVIGDQFGRGNLIRVDFRQAVDGGAQPSRIGMDVLVPGFVDARVFQAIVSTEIHNSAAGVEKLRHGFHAGGVRQAAKGDIAHLPGLFGGKVFAAKIKQPGQRRMN